MKTLLTTVMAGGLLLAFGSASQAQVNIQFGRNGTPSVTFGQPAYSPYANAYGQPYYGQPGYAAPNNYVQPYRPSYYSSGYSAPPRAYAPAYGSPYRPQTPYYGNAYSPYARPSYGSGTGVMINGRSYMLPR